MARQQILALPCHKACIRRGSLLGTSPRQRAGMATANAKPTKILFLTANPMDSVRLRIDKELKLIAEKLRSSRHGKSIVIVHEMAVTVDDITRSLLEERPDVVHFSGHVT